MFEVRYISKVLFKVDSQSNTFMTLILVRNNQLCHVKYWCNLGSKGGWKTDMCTDIPLSLSAFMRPPQYPSGLKPVAGLTEGKLIPIMFLNPQQFVLSRKVTLSGEKKKGLKLNVIWIMHVRGKTRLYRYLSDWLVLWQWGSISAPSLTLHSLLLSDDL